MSSKWRRYEVLLPIQFNDGRWKEKPEQIEIWLVSYRIEIE
jgi:hypothetical protein